MNDHSRHDGFKRPARSQQSQRRNAKQNHQSQKDSKKLIDSSLIDYYRNINEQLTEGFADNSHKELFLRNVFEHLVNDLLKVSRHQSTSFTVQKLLRLATADQLLQILPVFCSNFNECMTDRSTTYVVQTALYKSTEFFTSDKDSPFIRLLHQFGMQLLERSDLITSSYGSHVIRTLAEVMAGVKVKANIIKGKHAKQDSEELESFTPHDLYSEFQDLLTAIASRVIPVSPDTFDLIENTHTSALAETFMLIFKEKSPAQCQSFCDAIITSGNLEQLNEDGLPTLLVGETSSYFVSALVKVLGEEGLGRVLTTVIIPHIHSLVRHPQANFVVQDVIENLYTPDQFNAVCDHLQDHLSDLLTNNKGGVVVKMAIACRKFLDCQERFNKILLSNVVHSDSPGSLFLGLAASTPPTAEADQVVSALKGISYMHSLLLQKLFDFAECDSLCEGVMNLSTKYLIAMATTKFGSFALEGFLKSSTVHPAKKKAFAGANQDAYMVLATDKFGSRVFESIWQIMSVPVQRQVAANLGSNQKLLSRTPYGRAVAHKIRLTDYMHRKQIWEKWIIEANKQRKMALIAEAKNIKKPKKLKTVSQSDCGADSEEQTVVAEGCGELKTKDNSKRRLSKKKRQQLKALSNKECVTTDKSGVGPLVSEEGSLVRQDIRQDAVTVTHKKQNKSNQSTITDHSEGKKSKKKRKQPEALPIEEDESNKISIDVPVKKRKVHQDNGDITPSWQHESNGLVNADSSQQIKSKKKRKQLEAMARKESEGKDDMSNSASAKKRRKMRIKEVHEGVGVEQNN